jgi:hypothetical protein
MNCFKVDNVYVSCSEKAFDSQMLPKSYQYFDCLKMLFSNPYLIASLQFRSNLIKMNNETQVLQISKADKGNDNTLNFWCLDMVSHSIGWPPKSRNPLQSKWFVICKFPRIHFKQFTMMWNFKWVLSSKFHFSSRPRSFNNSDFRMTSRILNWK